MRSVNRLISSKSAIILLMAVFISSCTAYKKIPYMVGAETLSQSSLDSAAIIYEYKIKVQDALIITVNTTDPKAAIDFNMALVPNMTSLGSPTLTTSGTMLQNYIVDKDGNINFPVIGTIKLAGLTREEAQTKIYEAIYPKYLKDKPVVNIRSLSFNVSILGEVARPGTYSTQNDRMTIFDALANAGDLTVYGKRENVMLIREKENGAQSISRINLQDKNLILNRDLYYLQPNDKLIV